MHMTKYNIITPAYVSMLLPICILCYRTHKPHTHTNINASSNSSTARWRSGNDLLSINKEVTVHLAWLVHEWWLSIGK